MRYSSFLYQNLDIMSIIPQLLVAGTNSGCGKTTFTLGLLRSLARRGYDLASFKCGPDYIDPKFHALASGKPSINLDLFMMSEEHVRATYARYASKATACVVEGVMGLYDGSQKMQRFICRSGYDIGSTRCLAC